jgi:hypothetical protein
MFGLQSFRKCLQGFAHLVPVVLKLRLKTVLELGGALPHLVTDTFKVVFELRSKA